MHRKVKIKVLNWFKKHEQDDRLEKSRTVRGKLNHQCFIYIYTSDVKKLADLNNMNYYILRVQVDIIKEGATHSNII